mgnify:CR=1 FL=1
MRKALSLLGPLGRSTFVRSFSQGPAGAASAAASNDKGGLNIMAAVARAAAAPFTVEAVQLRKPRHNEAVVRVVAR